MSRGRSVRKAGQRFSGPSVDAPMVTGLPRVVGELQVLQGLATRARVAGAELLDMDDDTAETSVVDVRDIDVLVYQVVPNTGAHNTHVVRVVGRVVAMIDPGGADVEPNFRPISNLFGSPTQVLGGNMVSVDVRGLDEVLFMVATAEGATSTAYVAWNGVATS